MPLLLSTSIERAWRFPTRSTRAEMTIKWATSVQSALCSHAIGRRRLGRYMPPSCVASVSKGQTRKALRCPTLSTCSRFAAHSTRRPPSALPHIPLAPHDLGARAAWAAHTQAELAETSASPIRPTRLDQCKATVSVMARALATDRPCSRTPAVRCAQRLRVWSRRCGAKSRHRIRQYWWPQRGSR